MAQGINLLPEISDKDTRTEVYKKKVNVIAITSLLAIALIFMGLFAYQLFLQTSRSRVEGESKEKQEQILTQQTKEISQRTLVDKVTEIDKLLGEAVPTASAVATISDVAKRSGDVVVVKLSVKSDGDVIFSGSTSSTLSIQKLFRNLIDTSILSTFANVSLESLSKEEDQPYSFTINLDFLPKGLKNRWILQIST